MNMSKPLSHSTGEEKEQKMYTQPDDSKQQRALPQEAYADRIKETNFSLSQHK